MNVTLFKKLIKDAVTEAIHTELPGIINEALAKQNKQQISEGKTFNFNSGNVPTNGLPQDVRSSLMAQMGESFGYSQPQADKLTVIDVNNPEKPIIIKEELNHSLTTNTFINNEIYLEVNQGVNNYLDFNYHINLNQ